MADEELQDRTERATPKRREDARKKGDVPRSRELAMAGVMLCGAAALTLMLEPMLGRIAGGLRSAFEIPREQLLDPGYALEALTRVAGNAMSWLIPLVCVTVTAAFIGSTAIGGWAFSIEALAFKPERLNPVKGLERLFSANSLNELLKAVAKFGLVAVVAIAWLTWSVDELIGLGREPVAVAIPHGLRIAGISLLVISTSLIVIAAADVPFQLWSYERKIRMTRQDVREEYKETEGRPEVKSRIKVLQQQIANRKMMAELPTADVVITNPTHYSVALKYDEATMSAPKVIAKGQDLLALRIREVAEANGVPLFSAPPLARALYRSTKLGQEIHPGLYTAVAQVLAYIFQIDAALDNGAPVPDRPVPDVDETQF